MLEELKSKISTQDKALLQQLQRFEVLCRTMAETSRELGNNTSQIMASVTQMAGLAMSAVRHAETYAVDRERLETANAGFRRDIQNLRDSLGRSNEKAEIAVSGL